MMASTSSSVFGIPYSVLGNQYSVLGKRTADSVPLGSFLFFAFRIL